MPQEPEAQDESKPRKKLGCATGCALALLGLVILLGIFSAWWGHALAESRREFSRHVNDLLEEVIANYPEVPPEEDAAPLYAQAWPLYVQPTDDKLWYARDMDGAKPGTLEKYMADNKAYLAALKRAVAKPGYGLRADIRQGINARLSNISELRQAARFLGVAAACEARRGRPAEALKLLEIALRIARDAGTDNTMISHMVRMACEGIAVGALEKVLADSEPDIPCLKGLLKVLEAQLAGRRPMALVFRGEKVWALVTLEKLASGEMSLKSLGGGPSVGPDLAGWAWRASGLALKDVRNCERLMDEIIAAAEKPFPQARKEMAEVGDRVQMWTGSGPGVLLGGRITTGLMLPACGRVMDSDGDYRGRLQLARLALGCRLYKAKNGKYPAKLSDLSAAFPEHFGKLPTDPFTGKGFRYQKTEKGPRLWGAGRDGKDDGGVRRDPDKPRTPHDTVFEPGEKSRGGALRLKK